MYAECIRRSPIRDRRFLLKMAVGEGNAGLVSASEGIFGNIPKVLKSIAGCETAAVTVAGASAQIPNCPNGCVGGKIYRDGMRYNPDGSQTQRWLCTCCGLRFSDKALKSACSLTISRQICAKRPVRNLVDSATVQRTVAGVKEVSLLDYAWKLKKKNRRDESIQVFCSHLQQLIKYGADLNNPDSVETVLAVEPYFNDDEKPSIKLCTVRAYKSYTLKRARFSGTLSKLTIIVQMLS